MARETGDLAVGTLSGNKLYQRRARAALPILVRQAKAWQTTTYGALADEISMSNPRNLNYVLGAIGNSMLDLGATWGRRVPPIEALVVNQATRLPGEGVSWFTPDPALFKAATRQQKKLIVDAMLSEVFAFRDWEKVLGALKLQQLPPVSNSLPPISQVVPKGAAGEGKAHRKLKNELAQHPERLGLPKNMAPGGIEVLLYSADRVDVVFTSQHRRVAVEVKASGAPPGEVVRGLFQCVKYSALLAAEAKVEEDETDSSAILALGGAMPPELGGLRSILGVEVRDELDPGGA